MPDFEALGRRLASLNQQGMVPEPVREPLSKAIESWDTVIGAVDQFVSGWMDVYDNDDVAYDVKDPEQNDYHCNTCKASSAPVEELTTREMYSFLLDHAQHIKETRRKALGIIDNVENLEPWADLIKTWFVEEREAKEEHYAGLAQAYLSKNDR